jgi:hypothetical protein
MAHRQANTPEQIVIQTERPNTVPGQLRGWCLGVCLLASNCRLQLSCLRAPCSTLLLRKKKRY